MLRVPFVLAISLGAIGLGAACARSKPAQDPPSRAAEPQANGTPLPPPPKPQVPAVEIAGSPEQRGRDLYARMCVVCHGEHGEGYKADQATALAQPDFLASVSDNFLGFSIAFGRPGTTMSAWYTGAGGPLSFPEIKALTAFIRTWQTQPSKSLNEAEPHGDVAQGKVVFERECQRCHGDAAPNVRILKQHFLAHTTPGFLRYALQTGRPPTAMPSYRETLGDQGIEDVVTYLWSLPRVIDALAPSRPPPIPLGPVPLNAKGSEPRGFQAYPKMTSVAVVSEQLARKARMVVADARVPSDYERGHIAGAVSVPFYEPEPYFAKLPKSTWIVCYCGCPHAESGALAHKLALAGFSKVTVLDEGLGEWQSKGHPMREGRAP